MGRGDPDYPQRHSLAAVLAALQGDPAAAGRAIERTGQTRRDLGHYHHAQYDVACALAALGDHDSAIEWLCSAADNGYPCPTFFAIDPSLDPVREHTGYARLIGSLEGGHAEYERVFRGLPRLPA